jgi:hypothetical protein
MEETEEKRGDDAAAAACCLGTAGLKRMLGWGAVKPEVTPAPSTTRQPMRLADFLNVDILICLFERMSLSKGLCVNVVKADGNEWKRCTRTEQKNDELTWWGAGRHHEFSWDDVFASPDVVCARFCFDIRQMTALVC